MQKKLLGVILCGLAILGGLATVQPVWADGGDICSDDGIDEELRKAAGCNVSKTADAVINGVLQVVSGFMALLAVCVMIYGGFTYITSTGDFQKVARAKHIIIYGIVGLVVSLMAFVIVRFVSGTISG